MKISNLSFAIAALVGCASFCSVRAQDNSAQTAARAVLDMMLQPPTTNQVSPSVKTMGTNSVTIYHSLTPATNATYSGQPAEKKKSKPPVHKQAKPAKAKPVKPKPVPVVVEKAPIATPVAATSVAAISQAKVEDKKPVVPTPATSATAEMAANTKPPAKETKTTTSGLGLKPIVAPQLPISATKQSRLDDLLDLYKANRITPLYYQQQRAAILAEPN